ncbi:MAG: autotransporter-associated beta strand repeat-containing protein [Akkermansiaceae bacterium]|nr:autotransporter-associated beta strand repeat-containing protein [Akkermansiaceae bacterium]
MKPKGILRMFQSQRASLTPLVICTTLCAALTSHAAKTWTGSTDSAWGTAGNWLEAAVPGTTETAIFDSNSTGNLSTITLGANRTVKAISLSTPASDVTILAGSTLNLNGGGINMASATANLTNNAGTNLYTGEQAFTVASGRSLTLANLSRTTSGGIGNVNVGAALNIPSGGGTVKVGAAAVPVLLDGQGNPWVTFGNEFAGTDSSGFIVGVAPTNWDASIGTGFFNVPYAVKADFTQTGNGGVYGIVFNDTTTAYTLTLAGTTTFTGRAVLMTSDCVGGTITGGFLRPNRSASGAGGNSPMNFIQNSLLGDLRISSLNNASSSTTVSLVKSGVGKMIATGGLGYTGGTFINAGTLQVGDQNGAGATFTNGGLGTTSMVVTQTGATLAVDNSSDFTISAPISGPGSFVQTGSGTTTISGTNTSWSGAININAGAVAATTLDNLGTGTALGINGGALKFLGAFDPTSRAVTIGSSGATLDTNGNNISLASGFASGSTGSLTKNGAGTLTISASNDYSGGTTVNGGKLVIGASNATGSGDVTVNTGSTVGGTGSIGGTLDVKSGGIVTPGASVGTLSAGGLNLEAGSAATFEFDSGNDMLAVANSGGLTIDGGAITLLDGSALPFATPGTYNLISYSGAINGAGVSALSVANPQVGFSYTFGTSGGFVTLTIATTGVVTHWDVDADGSWGNAGNWSNGVPNGAGETAIFDKPLTLPRTVTLDAARTVGGIAFASSPNGYTITAGTGGSLVINNSGNDGAINNNGGTHTITADITLTSNVGLSSSSAADSITLTGTIAGAGSLTKPGPGQLVLSGSNTSWTGDVTLAGGTTTFSTNSLGTGDLSISGATLVWGSSNNQDISDRTVSFGADPVTFDTNGNDVVIAGLIGGDGDADLTKAGIGTLTLQNDLETFGNVTISGGTLALGNGGATGVVFGDILNNGVLSVNYGDTEALANLVSGSGSFVHAGTGVLELQAQNTFSGTTTIPNGGATLLLADSLNLQNSTVTLGSTGGSLSFDILTAATFGGLAGNKNLALMNVDTTPAAVALTVGGNNASTTYSGGLSGDGSLTKVGTGILTLAGANTYTGNTVVSAGQLLIATGGSTNGGAFSTTTATSGLIHVDGGNLLGTTCTLGQATGGLLLNSGTATFAGELVAINSGSNSTSSPVIVNGGTLTVPSMQIGRSGGAFYTTEPAEAYINTNLYLNGGDVNVTGNLHLGTGSTVPNSSTYCRIDDGTLTVGGALSIGLNNSGRWSILDVHGGNLVSTGTGTDSGVVIGGPYVGKQVLVINAGTATVERIQFGQGAVDGQGVLHVHGGELYVGSEGIVEGSSGAYTSEIRLSAGTLGAKANWSTDLGITLSASTYSTVMAADVNEDPFDITVNGPVVGAGSLDKYGDGALTLTGGHAYTGETTVWKGTLSVTTKTFDDSALVTVYDIDGAVLNLNFTGGDRIDSFTDDSGTYSSGTVGAVGSGADHETDAVTGSGLLYLNEDPPSGSAYDTWASGFSLTGGAVDDDDNDSVENVLEFVLGGNPTTSDTGVLPDVTVTATDYIFTFQREDDSEAEVTLTFEYGNNLSGWTELAIGIDTANSGTGVVVSENADAPDLITITVPKSGTKLFGRLKAVK